MLFYHPTTHIWNSLQNTVSFDIIQSCFYVSLLCFLAQHKYHECNIHNFYFEVVLEVNNKQVKIRLFVDIYLSQDIVINLSSNTASNFQFV